MITAGIDCGAKNTFFPNSRTVADVGAEEGRAVKIGENGNVVDFVTNEKCAAGAGVWRCLQIC